MSNLSLKPGTSIRKFVDFFHFFYLSFANHVVSRIPSYFIRKVFYKYFYRMKIGKNTHLQMGIRVYAPWKIKIGSYCSIGHDCLLDGRRGISIGNNVDLAGHVQIFTLGHNLDDPGYKSEGSPVKIEDHASLFTGASILPGRTIAEGSVAALASVVTKDTEPWTIYAGNPAKKIRKRKIDHLTYLHNYRRFFH
ncbi:acyltransferase [Mariniflexile litorale]|uniref:Acyltransferase n=1 Tax=Mariniflexile litorale TaxID=3045158 RepID=A0AAU7EFG9_9FLAO|nr:acyltransferase [Mariniflexile sp. KMM 9835]MDQ8209917.1 acyltransferase [Mariniflexile sp. KMM 9835]